MVADGYRHSGRLGSQGFRIWGSHACFTHVGSLALRRQSGQFERPAHTVTGCWHRAWVGAAAQHVADDQRHPSPRLNEGLAQLRILLPHSAFAHRLPQCINESGAMLEDVKPTFFERVAKIVAACLREHRREDRDIVELHAAERGNDVWRVVGRIAQHFGDVPHCCSHKQVSAQKLVLVGKR